MIRCEFEIGDDKQVVDTFDAYRFIYVDSDDTLHPSIVANEETSYADEDGCHSSMKYIQTGFEYKIKFLVLSSNRPGDRANTWIRKFVNDIHDGDELKDIVFYNTHKRIKIKGQLKDIDYSDLYRHNGIQDSVKLEMTLIVRDPSDCKFDYFANISGDVCFTRGYWVNQFPWDNDKGWVNI